MGLYMSSLWRGLIGANRDFRILMLGLDAAGKTTLLFKLKLGELITTIPTIGFNVESVEYRNLKFTIWDVGGQSKLRPLWRHYYQGTEALIYVVDSNDIDPDRIDLCKEELHHLLSDDAMRDAIVLVFANKQDLPNAMDAALLGRKLELERLRNPWYIQPCCAVNASGLYEGLDWVAAGLQKKK